MGYILEFGTNVRGDIGLSLEAAAQLTMRLSVDTWAQVEAQSEPPLELPPLEVPLGGLLASPGRVWVLASPGNLQPEGGP